MRTHWFSNKEVIGKIQNSISVEGEGKANNSKKNRKVRKWLQLESKQ